MAIEGLKFTPKYVRQESDLEYGEKVTHENYNAKLNLNTTQGDYNTDVLLKLLTGVDRDDTYHIPYLDADIERIDGAVENVNSEIANVKNEITDIGSDITGVDQNVVNIINGTTTVGRAHEADSLAGASTAGANKYYGTNDQSVPGFYNTPDFIYAVDMESSANVDGVYYIPALNSVAEVMLTPELREKVNRETITDYDYLTNKPSLNGVTISGTKVSSDYGLQPAGNYITDIALTGALAAYYTSEQTDAAISTALTDVATQSWVNTQLNSYATTTALSNVSTVANAAANVQVGSSWTGTPKTGDILITL